MSGKPGFWARRVLPVLVEKGCRGRVILEERRRWIPRAHGDVIELGVGSGLNLAFYDANRVAKVTAVDPSPPLLARAGLRAARAPVEVELVEASAERLPFGAEAFDSAVMTYSLCSMADPARALAEVRRVLRPGGELIFVEHGLAPDGATRWWQRRFTPIWRRFTGGCHLDRDVAAILGNAGYHVDQISAGFTEGVRWLNYTYQGTARPA
jgi:SAM-dependent methyltransferase